MANNILSVVILWTLVFYLTSAQGTSDCSDYSSYDEYESSWKAQYAGYAARGAYPFGTQFCDNNASAEQKTSGLNANIKFAIPFYGAIYRSLLISSNGFVTLNESSSVQSGTVAYLPIQWPNVHYSPRTAGAVDPPLIAPFYADFDFRVGKPHDPGQLSYRIIERGSSVATGMLDQISADVRRASVDARDFVAQSGVVVTWYQVTFSGAANCTTAVNVDTCRRNTIQMALVTDSVQTYAIFNYINVSWVGSGYMQMCDPATGMPSASSPQCQPAQVGFNAGNGRGFTSLPYTSAEAVAKLDMLSGTDVKGRWIYHVTYDVIRHAGCTVDPMLEEQSHLWPLVANATHGPMFGGQWVNVSGPCFDVQQTVLCRFGTIETPAIYWGNLMQVTCVQPPLTVVGPVILSVSVDYGQNYRFWTIFTVLQQERVDRSMRIAVTNPNADWLHPSEIELSWNPASLMSTEVVIQLFGDNHGHWDLLYTFNASSTKKNDGSFTIESPSPSMCAEQNPENSCPLYSYGVFRISGLGDNIISNYSRRNNSLPRPWPCVAGNCSRDVNLEWSPRPCNHNNATNWPQHRNSSVRPRNITLFEKSFNCVVYDAYNRRWKVVECSDNQTNPHWIQQLNFTSWYNHTFYPCLHYLEEPRQPSLNARTPARSLWSTPIPLGWFMNAAATKTEGTDWPHKRCSSWQTATSSSPVTTPDKSNWQPPSSQTANRSSVMGLEPCPCTLRQATVDFGRFQPALDCNADSSQSDEDNECWTNRGSQGCFQSVHTTSSGASNRCCYNQDGDLMYAGDSDSGSHIEYSAPWGLSRLSGKVPSLSHWRDDLIPYYFCCGWQRPPETDSDEDELNQDVVSTNYVRDCFSVYGSSRPTIDCKNYKPPGKGAVIGDPHFITFDNTNYSFNGWGEFWLVRVKDPFDKNKHGPNSYRVSDEALFALQGRLEPISNQTGGQPSGTVLTAIALRLINSPLISITVNDHNVKPRLLVYVNKTLLDFNAPNMFWQQISDVIVISNDQSQSSNVTVIFQQGIGVNVAWKSGALFASVSLPPEFQTYTEGLLGLWNGNPTDDLTPRASTSAPNAAVSASDPTSVYYKFGLSWIVQPNETLFTNLYRAAMNYDYYRNTNFVPALNFTIASSAIMLSSDEMTAVCGGNTACLFDFAATGSPSLAAETLAAFQLDAMARQMAKPVLTCGWLNIPFSVRKGEARYTVGSQITVEGCMPGYRMTGMQTTYMCIETTDDVYHQPIAVWSPDVAQTCYYVGNGLAAPDKIAIIIPLVIIGTTVMVALAGVCILSGCRRRKQRRKQRANEKNVVNATSSTMVSPPTYTAAGPGKSVVSPLIVPAVSNADDWGSHTPEATVITGMPFNRVVRGSMSGSSLMNVAEPQQQQGTYAAAATASAPSLPRYSLVSTSTTTSGTATTQINVVCGPLGSLLQTSLPVTGSMSNLDATMSDVFPPVDENQPSTFVAATKPTTAGNSNGLTGEGAESRRVSQV